MRQAEFRFHRYHIVMNLAPLAADILDFWLGPPPHATRDVWFRKDPAFDAEIARRFGAAVEAALGGQYRDWTANCARHARARAAARPVHAKHISRHAASLRRRRAGARHGSSAVDAGFDRTLDRYERWFLYMPFEAREDIGAQERSLALFGALAAESGDPGQVQWAEKHAVIVRRFGRFPHRNSILGRTSTAEEVAFLQEPGSRF
jgi:uncharacterized protein (DUF924 family)